VRLSPKSIFFGIVALGLPIAVTIGWTLGTPTKAPASTAGLGRVGGEGGIGAAPVKPTESRPVTPAGYGATAATPTPSAVLSSPVPTTAVAPPPSATPGPPSLPTESPLPSLGGLPPVPTPTEITDPSTSASAPAGSEPEATGIDPAQLAGTP
jgi:hypothetical protein